MKRVLIGSLTAFLGFYVLSINEAIASPPPYQEQNPIACLDQQQRPVDWWVILKLPKNSNPATSGTSYLYIDANNPFNFYDNGLGQSNQALGYTVNQWYENTKNDSVGWAIYNDEPSSAYSIASSNFQ